MDRTGNTPERNPLLYYERLNTIFAALINLYNADPEAAIPEPAEVAPVEQSAAMISPEQTLAAAAPIVEEVARQDQRSAEVFDMGQQRMEQAARLAAEAAYEMGDYDGKPAA